jgi:hypothetical protein
VDIGRRCTTECVEDYYYGVGRGNITHCSRLSIVFFPPNVMVLVVKLLFWLWCCCCCYCYCYCCGIILAAVSLGHGSSSTCLVVEAGRPILVNDYMILYRRRRHHHHRNRTEKGNQKDNDLSSTFSSFLITRISRSWWDRWMAWWWWKKENTSDAVVILAAANSDLQQQQQQQQQQDEDNKDKAPDHNDSTALMMKGFDYEQPIHLEERKDDNNNDDNDVAWNKKNQHSPNPKQPKAKTGRQKMQSCRHLVPPSSTRMYYYRWWKRGRNIIHMYRTMWNRFRHGNVDNIAMSRDPTTNVVASTSWISYSRDMNLAYCMAVMASLSYWPFHKRPLPDNRTSFELLTLKNGTPQPLRRKRRRKRDRAIGLALKGFSSALNQASPWLPKSRRNRQNRGSYRESWKTSLQNRLLKSEQLQHEDPTNPTSTIRLEYFLYNWYEPAPLGVNYHDTDLLVATSNNGNTLILAFAGTDSVPDTVSAFLLECFHCFLFYP